MKIAKYVHLEIQLSNNWLVQLRGDVDLNRSQLNRFNFINALSDRIFYELFSAFATNFFFATYLQPLKSLLFGTSLAWHWFIWQNYTFLYVPNESALLFFLYKFGFISVLSAQKVNCLWKCVSSQSLRELRRELMLAIIHIHAIASILVRFFYYFEMLTSSKWVSLYITRTNQMENTQYWIAIVILYIRKSIAYTFLVVWFIGSWVIDTFRHWTSNLAEGKKLRWTEVILHVFDRTTKIIHCLKYRKKYFNNAKLPVWCQIFLYNFRSWLIKKKNKRNKAARVQACFFFVHVRLSIRLMVK